MQPDVIVVGGGMAGLAATRELSRRRWKVRLLEARARLGGRVLSVKPNGWPCAVELGAEFVHGGSRQLRALFRDAGVPLVRVKSNMWRAENGELQLMPDYWEKIGRVAERIPKQDRGQSFHRFLQQQRRNISLEDRELAAAYVGSFNAAPVTQISAHALREKRAGADTVDLKIAGRYDTIVQGLKEKWSLQTVDLRLETAVTKIVWERGSVLIECRTSAGRKEIHRARAAVITLPLGVLKAHRVLFQPPLKKYQHLIDRAGWGNAVRIVIRFRRGFWSAPFMPRKLSAGRGKAFGFINAPGESIPVWWALATPAPILTGWAGGEIADEFGTAPKRSVLTNAIKSLASILETTRHQLASWIAGWEAHNWQRDPFSLGAYSFPRAGEEDVGERLAEPVRNTLFFAGEALAADYGTVHGAMKSGREAADRVCRALARQAKGKAID